MHGVTLNDYKKLIIKVTIIKAATFTSTYVHVDLVLITWQS